MVVLALSVCALTLAVGAPGEEPPLKIGESAPSFALKTMNPEASKIKVFTLAHYAGERPEKPKKAVVLTFGASYCEPCKKELAELKALQPKLDKADVILAVVVIDTDPEGIEAMRKLTMDQLGLGYPVLSDRFGVLSKRYRAYTLPFTVIIDPAGKISWLHSGFEEGSIAKLTSKLGI